MKAVIHNSWYILLKLSIITLLFSCKSGPVNLFKAVSPHEAYQHKLISAGLDKTMMGNSWIGAANQSLEKALNINIPFRETGYFAAEKVPANAYRFTAIRGQKLSISLSKTPADQFIIYADLWEYPGNSAPGLLASADTLNNTLHFDVKTTGTYLLRLQPELLRSGQYTLEITTGPSLGFPVKSTRAKMESFFGDGRDANSRKHEGIDIFEKFHTPVIAAAEGTIVRVNENKLGGRVVWLRPKNKDYTLYYAHLDKQMVTEGQQVLTGDTLGLMGNTGNARTTPTHLHFGIYTNEGAINPLPFIDPLIKSPPKIRGIFDYLDSTVRTTGPSILYQSTETNAPHFATLKTGSIIHVIAANDNWYTVQLPNGLRGFIQNKHITSTKIPLRRIKITSMQQEVYDRPNTLAAVKFNLTSGLNVNVLGNFENYYFIEGPDKQTGWIKS